MDRELPVDVLQDRRVTTRVFDGERQGNHGVIKVNRRYLYSRCKSDHLVDGSCVVQHVLRPKPDLHSRLADIPGSVIGGVEPESMSR